MLIGQFNKGQNTNMSASRKAIFDSVKAATVALAIMTKKKDGTCPYQVVGSGFCIDPIGIVLTCRHVLSAFMAKPIEEQLASFEQVKSDKGTKQGRLVHRHIPYVIFYKPRPERLWAFPIQATNCIAKTNFDVAAVRVKQHVAYVAGFPSLQIEDLQDVYEGERVGTCGFPLGNYLHKQLGTATSSFSEGIISSIIPAPNVRQKHLKGFQLDIVTAPGSSGGPVFSLTSGKVFGVLQCALSVTPGAISALAKAEPVYPIFEHDAIKSLKEMKIPKTNAEARALLDETIGKRRNMLERQKPQR